MISFLEVWRSGLSRFLSTSLIPAKPFKVAPLVRLKIIVSRLSSAWCAVRM